MAKNLGKQQKSKPAGPPKAASPHKRPPQVSKAAAPKAASKGTLKGSPPPKKSLAVSGRSPTQQSKGSSTPPARVVNQSRQSVENYLGSSPLADGSGIKAGKEKREPAKPWAPGDLIPTKPPSEVPIITIGGWEVPRDPKTSSAQDIEDTYGEGEFLSPGWFVNWAAGGAHISYGWKQYMGDTPTTQEALRLDYERRVESLAGREARVQEQRRALWGEGGLWGTGLGNMDLTDKRSDEEVRRDVQRRYGGNVRDWR